MKPAYLLGIDIGTQGTQAVLVDAHGRVRGTALHKSRLKRPAPGAVEEDPEYQFRAVCRCIRDCLAMARIDPAQVAAIGIDGQMAGILGSGADGRHVTPYDSWLDTRCSAEIARMKREAGDEIICKTGGPPSFNHGPKILWWKRQHPEVYRRIAAFVQPGAYAAMRLCELPAAEAFIDTTYLHFSGFADNARGQWDADLCRSFGVAAAKLPRIVDPQTVVGHVTARVAARCKLIACWLGQAGFLLGWGDVRLAIDPYLSDSLAVKYRGTRFPHRRMMPLPIAPWDVKPLDAVFCTHSHSDHMDPDTLAPLAATNPACRFVVPRSARGTALERGIPAERLIAADAGESGTLPGGVCWYALASAHEQLATDAAGQQRFLGYVIEFGGLRIYHSGDCVPYPGLAAELRRRAIHVAILPVNGRDAQRTAAGIPGNFTFDEAVELCRQAGIDSLLVYHFGMFDFNTVDEAWLDERIAALARPPQCVRPGVASAYELQPRRDASSDITQSRCPSWVGSESQPTAEPHQKLRETFS